MGRVYDALTRAGATELGVSSQRQSSESQIRGEGRNSRILPSAKQIEEQLFSVSSILAGAEDGVRSSAFTAHTANAPEGTALPIGMGSRAVGATLNAARPARARGFVAYDVSAARVEPHLVAITQPRSCLLRTVSVPAYQNFTSGRARANAHFRNHQCRNGRGQDGDCVESWLASRPD